MKLLIADDDITSRAILDAVARKWGYDTVVVEDGEAAWQALQDKDPPRLLLLDWMMPELDGLDLCKRIREQETSDPPFIIILTARTGTDDIVKVLEAGANDHIAKPFDNAELQARLRVGRRMLGLQGELNEAKEALYIQATRDALTGLLNRGAINEELKEEMARARRSRQPLCIGLCDIDHFKRVNDTYGHLVGDSVLRDVADRIAGSIRPYDHAGRYGGEEFLIIVTATDEHALAPFERIRQAIEVGPFVIEDQNLDITISCGVAIYSALQYGDDDNALIGAADIALYQAKDAGRNQTILSKQVNAADDSIIRKLGRRAP